MSALARVVIGWVDREGGGVGGTGIGVVGVTDC